MDLKYLFYSTFIIEDRYMFFLRGLGSTLLLTFASFILGIVFAVLLCAAQRSDNPALRNFANAISRFLVEIPTVVLLMVFVYVIFGSSALPLMLIVIVGLTLKAGAYLAAIFNSALDTVNPGEIEAARTLGMSRFEAFRYVSLPQAAAAALPLCQNQFIATMQESSVVGYLAVMDMTRAASIVASRTMNALFGLIVVSVAYLLIGAIVKALMAKLIKKRGALSI
jgi:His/Glu/Gln/Arg/opine family amino acid ABC transporter permease subunit